MFDKFNEFCPTQSVWPLKLAARSFLVIPSQLRPFDNAIGPQSILCAISSLEPFSGFIVPLYALVKLLS